MSEDNINAVWTFQLFPEGKTMPSWAAILLEKPHGAKLWHQYGGLACLHIQLQGEFVRVDLALDGDTLNALGMETLGDHLTDDEISLIDSILPPDVEIDQRSGAYEALVPITWHGEPAWFIWENSD